MGDVIDITGRLDLRRYARGTKRLARFLHELRPGETWTKHPTTGIIVAHPERAPMHIYEQDGKTYWLPICWKNSVDS